MGSVEWKTDLACQSLKKSMILTFHWKEKEILKPEKLHQ